MTTLIAIWKNIYDKDDLNVIYDEIDDRKRLNILNKYKDVIYINIASNEDVNLFLPQLLRNILIDKVVLVDENIIDLLCKVIEPLNIYRAINKDELKKELINNLYNHMTIIVKDDYKY